MKAEGRIAGSEQDVAGPDGITVAAGLGAIVVAAANPVAVRFTVFELDPFWGATVRLLAAGLIFAVLVAVLGLDRPSRSVLIGGSIYGAVLLGEGISAAFLL